MMTFSTQFYIILFFWCKIIRGFLDFAQWYENQSTPPKYFLVESLEGSEGLLSTNQLFSQCHKIEIFHPEENQLKEDWKKCITPSSPAFTRENSVESKNWRSSKLYQIYSNCWKKFHFSQKVSLFFTPSSHSLKSKLTKVGRKTNTSTMKQTTCHYICTTHPR